MTDQPLNREQRRAERYRPDAGRPDPHDVLARGSEADAATEAGPVADEAAGPGGDDSQAFARSGSGDVSRTTGAGAAGATESDDRMPNHEGAHYGNQPNS
jgi:hypothetical protein